MNDEVKVNNLQLIFTNSFQKHESQNSNERKPKDSLQSLFRSKKNKNEKKMRCQTKIAKPLNLLTAPNHSMVVPRSMAIPPGTTRLCSAAWSCCQAWCGRATFWPARPDSPWVHSRALLSHARSLPYFALLGAWGFLKPLFFS